MVKKTKSKNVKIVRETKVIEKTKVNDKYLSLLSNVRTELSRVVVGQEAVVEGIIRAMISNGHVLVEGVPGIAKTLIIRTMSVITGCKFGRIQFTVDLLPSDIIGITTLSANQTFKVVKGPIFANFLIADEINRATPKTQSALLEAMAEHQVSINKESFKLAPPFFVMATQNPIESSGTYPLPEAQIDRFLFKLIIDYPKKAHEEQIIETNTALKSFEAYKLKKIIKPEDIIKMQELVQKVKHTRRINKYIVELVNATRDPKEYGIELGKYISLGASPRASIFLFIAAKADAFLNGCSFVKPQNVKNIAHDVLRHRMILNYKAKVNDVKADDIIDEILAKVKIP